MKNTDCLPVSQWRFSIEQEDITEQLSNEFGILPLMSKILMSRNIVNLSDARKYLFPSLNDLHNPFLMNDMDKAVHRVIQAIQRKEKIVVFGDYDADGITSIAVMLKFFRVLLPETDFYIPDRIGEGYGLNRGAIDLLKSRSVDLIITVDCGVSDLECVAYASTLGIDTIILDHHEVPEILPHAVAVIDPHRPDCHFPFKHLAGVGIAFNFLIGLRGKLRQEGFWNNRTYPNLKDYLDLVALGTIGDISPLVDENRIFTKIGLDLITEDKRVGLKALKEICGIETQVMDTNRSSFCLIPRINAAGRVGSPTEAVKLLLTDDLAEARDIARVLDGYNRKRQTIEKTILHEILEEIAKTIDPHLKSSLVFASANWHPGVIGIVASRLVDRFYRPAILISLRNGIGKGSGRSIADFNIYQGLKKCESLLLSYGGHQYAAGISIREEDIEEFKNLLEGVIREDIQPVNMISQTTIDAQCQLHDVNHDLLAQIAMLAPFGSRNPEPVLCVRNVNVAASNIVGNNHLRLRLNGDGVSCNGIWFSKGHFIKQLTSGTTSDIAFTPQFNYWNGVNEIQLKMKDMSVPAG
ncbi:MAG: single-stranded-DNA-specific exonuclease RecJ [Deltaproteobacteria bacterium]|nr:single-stranded-DNA-specific exonuclease RecJ [Deltaproteobacteria bacterium]